MSDVVDKLYVLSPVFVLIFSRISGMVATMPILSYPSVPMRVRMHIAIIISFLLLPTMTDMDLSQMTGPMLGISVMRELFIGLVAGFGARVIFESFNMAGSFIGRQMGLALANVMDPTSHQQIPLVSQLMTLLAVTFFFVTNSHHLLMETLYRNFTILPLGSGEFNHVVGEVIVGTGSKAFEIAIHYAAPAMVFMLLIDTAIAFTARIMPQMNIFMVMMPLKLGIGLIVLILSMDIFQSLFDMFYMEVRGSINDTIISMSGS